MITNLNKDGIFKKNRTLKLELKKMEFDNDTKLTEGNLQNILDSMPYGVIIIGKDKVIRMVNNYALETLGYESDKSIRGKECNKTICPFIENACPILDLGDNIEKSEQLIITKDNNMIPVQKSVIPILFNNEEVLLEAFLDISHLKKTEQNLLDEKNKAEFFLDLLVHDINNQNQVSIGYCELLLMDQDLSQNQRNFINKIHRQSLAVKDFIVKIKSLINLKKDKFILESVNLKQLLMDSIEKAKSLHPDRQIEITLDSPGTEIIVSGNKMFTEIFKNIIDNSIKFNRNENVVVDISCTLIDDGKKCKIEFKDNGPGIADRNKESVFQRLENYDENEFQSGLGLTVAQEVVSLCNGMVWIEDRVPGKHSEGANVIFVLQINHLQSEIS